MLNKNAITQLSAKINEPGWFVNKRLEAFQNFEKMEMPVFKYGIGIFLDTKNLQLENINPLEKNSLKITSDKAQIFTLDEALKKHPDLVKKYFMCTIKEDNKLIEMHKAFLNSFSLIIIPDSTEAKVEINSILESSCLEHILIVAKPNSKAVIIEHSSSKRKDQKIAYKSQVIEIIAHENAKVDYVSLQNLDKNVYNFSRRKSLTEKDAEIYWLDCCLGSLFTQSITTSLLEQPGSTSRSLGLFLGDENQRFDLHVETVHKSGNTTCDMLTKGVLNDKSKNVYRGLIRIEPSATNCKAYQHSETLLLSEHAETDPVPILEINNNDVKCGHGSAVGQIDKEKIFYMMSRGLSEEEAIETVIKGFFEPVIDQLKPEMAEEIRKSINQRIDKGLHKEIKVAV